MPSFAEMYFPIIPKKNKKDTSKVEFSYSNLSVNITKKLDKKTKSNGGIFFTPPSTVNYTIQFLKPYIDKIKGNVDVLEPSCGSGEWIKQMLSVCNNSCIDAVEFNKDIYDAIVPHFSPHFVSIFNTNFLTFNSDNVKKYDFVVGNPPYFNMRKNEVNSSLYPYFTGRPNIYILFIIRGLQMLKEGGILSYVVPHSFLSNISFNQTRKWIYESFNILNIEFIKDKYLETTMKTVLIVFQKPCVNCVVNQGKNDCFTYHSKISVMFSCPDEIKEMKSLAKGSVSVANFDVLVRTCRLGASSAKTAGEIKRTGKVILCHTGFAWKPYYTFKHSLITLNDKFVKADHALIISGTDIEYLFECLKNEKTKRFIRLYSKNSQLNIMKELLYVLPVFPPM